VYKPLNRRNRIYIENGIDVAERVVLRSGYQPHYCAAFVLDPDGHNTEAVCHAPA